MSTFRADSQSHESSVPANAQSEASKSRLSHSLLRLHKSMEASRQHEQQMQRLFKNWEDRWSSQSTELAQRLEYIESQLSDLSDEEDASPRLSVVSIYG